MANENNNKAKKALIFWIAMFIVALAIAGAVAAYTVKNESQTNERSNREYLNRCLDEARKSYDKEWKETASALGVAGDRLPQVDADFIDNRYKMVKDDCYKYYETIK